MPGYGPAPKVTSRRNRAPKVRGDWVVLDRVPGPVPELPVEGAPQHGWSGPAVRAWRSWWSGPASVMWDESDYESVEMLLRMVHEYWEKPSATAFDAIRLARETLGIGPKGRQDRRWLLPEEKALGLAPVEAAKVIPILAGD